LATGKPVEEVPEAVYPEAIEKALGGLPEDSRHCAELAAEALQEAVDRYFRSRRRGAHEH
jgi:nitrogen fixation NifU-like protein